ncbi:MAG: DUF4397 domain-containing protein [Gemmatimonadaceae bacterium]
MRLTRFIALGFAGLSVVGCDDDQITTPTLPPNAQVRFISAISDTGAVDIKMIDQVDLSAFANTLGYRQGTLYQQTESKTRRIRVFPTSTNAAITSQILLDTTIAIQANTRITLMLVGPSRTAGQLRFVTINDETSAPPSGQIAVRMVNASSGSANGYLVNAVGDPLPGAATFSNVGTLAASAYASKAAGATAIRVTETGSATIRASVAGPNAPAAVVGGFPGAGVQTAGTGFSAYYFPPARAGSVSSPSVIWFVDRNPCDAGC